MNFDQKTAGYFENKFHVYSKMHLKKCLSNPSHFLPLWSVCNSSCTPHLWVSVHSSLQEIHFFNLCGKCSVDFFHRNCSAQSCISDCYNTCRWQDRSVATATLPCYCHDVSRNALWVHKPPTQTQNMFFLWPMLKPSSKFGEIQPGSICVIPPKKKTSQLTCYTNLSLREKISCLHQLF